MPNVRKKDVKTKTLYRCNFAFIQFMFSYELIMMIISEDTEKLPTSQQSLTIFLINFLTFNSFVSYLVP